MTASSLFCRKGFWHVLPCDVQGEVQIAQAIARCIEKMLAGWQLSR